MKRCALRGALHQQRRMKMELSPDELAARLAEETAPPKVLRGLLDKSIISTLHFQKSLPRLGIPKLEETCKNYINSVTPLLTSEELTKTEKLVADFEKGDGMKLHEQLLAKDKMNKHTSYISADWYDMYLSARSSLPLNWSPYLVFRKDPAPDRNTASFRAAAFIHASVLFKNAFDENTLRPEVFHLKPATSKTGWFQNLCKFSPSSISAYVSIAAQAYPLDMSQFPRLFNTTRVPRIIKDELKTSPGNHVVIFHKGHPYKVTVVDKNGNPLDTNQIASRIQAIIFDSPDTQNEFPLGSLTAAERNEWANLREEVEMNEDNKKNLDIIDSALFAVCIDDESVDMSSAEKVTQMGRQFLHGNALKGNRWWDKSFSLLVSKNGICSCNFEHSWGDGVAVMRWANDAWHLASQELTSPKEEKPTEPIQRLDFRLSENVKNSIKKNMESFHKETQRMDYDVSVYPGLGKNGLKKLKVKPDGFMQQSFQLAFRRLYGETRCTYESASTSGFKHGRTEAIRAATIESKEFCLAVTNNTGSTADRHALMQTAIAKHGEITTQALMGKGVDRHLFTLRKLAERQGMRPELFDSRSYSTLNENIISTSTLYSDTLMLGGFGPVHEEGFGVGYSATPDLLFLGVTSYSRDCRYVY